MDMRSWKKVLLQWITECGFAERNYFNIEQSDIDVFYQKFRSKHKKIIADKFNRLGDFLKEFYPGFEINWDDENYLSSADYIYVYSLLLQFCCVKCPETEFHEICQRLPEFDQQCIAEFFKELLDTEPVTKDSLRNAIAKIANIQITPPRLNDSFSSGVTSVSGLSAISISRCDSPLKTPKRCAGTQRISPPTPKTHLLEERTKELYKLKAQLETERYEKGLLEAQIILNEDEIQKLNNDHKRLLHQIQDLKNDIYTKTSDGSTNSDDESYQIRKQLLKEISLKEQDINKLSNNARNLREEKTAVEQKLIHAEKQTILCMNQIKQLESKCDELSDELKQKNDHIKYLTDNKQELEQFIIDTRSPSAGANRYLNVSEDCLDSSFLRNTSNSNGSNSLSSPENLGVSVVDIQLREKEQENQLLKEELKYVQREQKRLAKHLTKLTQEFDLIKDTPSSNSSEYFVTDNEQEQCENDSSKEDQISCQEQLNILNSCMEKIDKFRKTERNKVRQMEAQSNRFQEENINLTRKLNELSEEIKIFKNKLTAQEKLQREVEKSKGEMELVLQKSQKDMLSAEKQKNKLHSEVKSLQNNNEKLNESIQQLTTKLELQQQAAKELSAKNKKLEENEQTLQNQLHELEKVLSNKTLQWEQQVQQLNERITKQVADIEICRQTEETIKCNYEQTVVRNEELKKEARVANSYLCEMRNNLKEKENQLSLLGKEIAEFKQQNKDLEQDISILMEEHKQEMLTSRSAKSDLDGQLAKLKDQLSKIELLMDSKQHECELKEERLGEIEIRITVVRKLFSDLNESDNANKDVYVTIDEVKAHVQNMLKNNKELINKVADLQESNKKALKKIEELTEEAKEKSIECDKHQKELIRLNADILVCEKKIEELQHEKVNALKKAQTDLKEKEQELQDRLKEASIQYEDSMERIAVELKLEKEHHNTKEMELILSKAEHDEAKKKLSEAEIEIQKICADNQQLMQCCERLKQFETRVIECSEENDKLRKEIETFKQQVSTNALRLLQADKALAEFMVLTKEQDSARCEAELLQIKLNEKEKALIEMELKLQQQYLYEEQLTKLKQQQEEQTEQVAKLSKYKERLIKDNEEKEQQISKEQQDKLVLLTSLEKTTDQFRSLQKEKHQQCDYLEQQLHDLKEKINCLTQQNTNLQINLVEREAEMRLSLDDLQQENEDIQQKLDVLKKELSEKSEQLQTLNMSLMDIAVIMENNFNLSQELLQKDVNNPFNYQEKENDKIMQKLKKHLNHILFHHQQLNKQLSQQSKTLKETQKQLENEDLIVEKRVMQEVKRLEEDLSNLEKVNERLTSEYLKVQDTLSIVEEKYKDSKTQVDSLERQTLELKEEICTKTLIIEKLQHDEQKLQHTLKEKCEQIEKLSAKAQHFECQLKDKSTKIQNLDKEYQEAKEKAHKNQQKLLQHQQTHQKQQAEYKNLQEKLQVIQNCNDALEIDVGNKQKEISTLKNKTSELLQKHTNLEHQLNTSSKKLDELTVCKLNAETKCDQLQSEVYQLKRDLDFAKAQHQAQQEDNIHLNQEIESLKVDKEHLRGEIRENNIRLQQANENVSELIQEISFIRLEKEGALEENLLLRKQLEEKGKNQTSSETKLKSIIEKSQDLERKLLSAENELKSLRANLEKSENCAEKLQIENKKLRSDHETSTKRIEKLALKLGDAQAKSSKLERDNEKLVKNLETHSVTVEGLQKEKDMLQIEAKSLKERLSRAERGHEQLVAKVQNLEHININLQQIKQKLEDSEIDGKTKLNKLEKMREINEEKIRKLTNSLNKAENDNVKLNLEIGALNSQLKEAKVENVQANSQQNDASNQKLIEAHELNQKYQEINEKLTLKLNILKEENSSLNDQLSKTALSLQITSAKCERLAAEMEQIHADLQTMRQEKTQIEQQHEISIQKFNKFESENATLLYDSKNQLKALKEKINNLEDELTVKTKKNADLENEIKILKESSESQNSLSHQDKTTNSTELEVLRQKLSLAEDVRLKDEEIISQLRLDNQILHTKYQESKQSAKASEERIKENRLELEGKLEKMKSKMKTLFTEEINKMKAKQDRETALLKSEIDVLKTQNAKYEEHTRKLSNQIVRLNDNILQYQKENMILSTKLKHITEQLHECERNKRSATIHVSKISSSTTSLAGSNIAPNNLAMEDEEGEVFNNTYLTDLKNGRMSELMSRDVCVEELKYRNSLLPPHLRSTYAAQFDHEFPEDDIKDGPHSFDDSMSALLSTTAGGTRKKCTGVTHYKRPGPPTPSKHGGRLSLGANTDLAREILKESYDANAGSAAVSSSKTPARFNFFSSRFSMSNTKDENTPPKRRLSNMFKRK